MNSEETEIHGLRLQFPQLHSPFSNHGVCDNCLPRRIPKRILLTFGLPSMTGRLTLFAGAKTRKEHTVTLHPMTKLK